MLKAIALGVLEIPSQEPNRGGFGWKKDLVFDNIVKVITIQDMSYHYYDAVKIGDVDPTYSKYLCVINGSPAFMGGIFTPTTPEALATLCGCEVKDLPDVLQHWFKHEQYYGNCILDRVDPLEWVVKNPWKNMNFDVVFYLSKSGYNQLRRKQKLKPNRFWEVKKTMG